ncbi:MAG: hypothetical protein E6R08_09835 [Nevskiaceae bacterium]|nr:MAG: hypothetical protein E6R08_09835 [Nevskiaceae bacterium]
MLDRSTTSAATPQFTTTVELPDDQPVMRQKNAAIQVIDGALVVSGDDGAWIFAPGERRRAYTVKSHG